MADIFSGIAPPNVNTTQTTQTIAPAQYLGFLSTLGTAGTNALDPNQTLQGNIAAGQPYVAPLSANQQTAFGNASDVAQTYQAPLSSAIGTANTAATPVGQSQINNFLNPYVTDVNKALETNTAQNVNQNILPALQAFYAGSGGTGSSRALNTTGQTLANIQTGLGAQESTNLSDAYKNAVTAALQSQSNRQKTILQVLVLKSKLRHKLRSMHHCLLLTMCLHCLKGTQYLQEQLRLTMAQHLATVLLHWLKLQAWGLCLLLAPMVQVQSKV